MKEQTIMTQEKINDILENLKTYMKGKSDLDNHLSENSRWYEEQYNTQKASKDGEILAPTSGFLFNSLVNKHADAMDNYPDIEIWEREPRGAKTARALSHIIPAEFRRMNFRHTYSRGWWSKLKHGSVCYGVFYSPEEAAVSVKKLNLLNLYWSPGVENIQDSPYLFILSSLPRKEVEARYPVTRGKEDSGVFHFYRESGREVPADYTVIVDCYEKRINSRGKTIVHLTKLWGENLLDSTFLYDELLDKGLYDHGEYPVVMDVLYPIEGSPAGFGLVDIAKNPQCYIDKLDDIISRNALLAGKYRFMIKDNGGVNETELLDSDQDLIHVAGSLGEENIRAFQPRTLDPYIIEHRQNKIKELKEITGNRDINTGGVAGNVTGYSAITALQDAGRKAMRDMVSESYSAVETIIRMCLSLMAQFYPKSRLFPVETGNRRRFIYWSEQAIKEQNLHFDIKLTPSYSADLAQDSANTMALTLFEKGFFQPERREEARIALRMMNFDSKWQIEDMLAEETADAADEKIRTESTAEVQESYL